jgi:DSF synthase
MGESRSTPAGHLLPLSAPLVDTEFDPQQQILWITMAMQRARPQNFSWPLLRTLQELLTSLAANNGGWLDHGEIRPVNYAVMASAHPMYFSLGGDLGHFLECINRHDGESLQRYSADCLDMMYRFAQQIGRQTTTIALVQGRALGGGFETALAANYIIAEEHAEFGLPEILFGLFPCTGALSLLGRRVGLKKAEELATNGRIYSAAELHEMGIVDEVCPTGSGHSATSAFILEHSKRQKARQALRNAWSRMAPLDYQELSTVVSDWVDAALRLSENELRVLNTLVKMQRAELAH